VTLTSAKPTSLSNLATMTLTPGPGPRGLVTLNSTYPCLAVPANRHTWGQLNSLYR
jgi:hypothetical protein